MAIQAEVTGTQYQKEQFQGLTRQLFGNITQRFLRRAGSERINLSTLPLGACQLSQIAAPAHGVLAPNAIQSSYDADSIKVLVQVRGKSRLRHNAERVDLMSNSAVIYDPVHEYSLMNATGVEQIVLQTPRHLFDARMLKRLSRPLFLPSTGAQQSQTLSAFIRTSAQTAKNMSVEMRQSLGQSLTVFTQGIVNEAFRADMAETVQQGSLMLLRERIAVFVGQNLTDPELSIDGIAKRMGCSPRYLHKAFRASDETLQRYILQQRLNLSQSLLLAPENLGKTIAEIAFGSGFNSSAHFCRVFKNRYGMSPNEMRASHLTR